MKPVYLFAGAIFLLVSGAMKIFKHNELDSLLASSWCESSGLEQVGSSYFLSGHCWGCFAVLAGMALLGWAIYSVSKSKFEFQQSWIGALK